MTYLVVMVSHVGPELVFMCVPLSAVLVRTSMIIFPGMRAHVRAKIEI